ncbi:MAG: hypothetical protein U1C73_09975 [Dietzia sp.]|nr:hypothetical protein [Dietzia sp.]
MTRRIAALLVPVTAALVGCAGAETSTAPPPGAAASGTGSSTAASPSVASAPTEPTSGPAPVEVDSRIADGRVEPFPGRVDVTLGTPVVIRIEADAPAEIHVHGYDLLAEAAPGAPARIDFVADVSGVFEVEAHPGTLLFQLAVQ